MIKSSASFPQNAISLPVILIAWLFTLFTMYLLWPLPPLIGSLPDTDDYMRMTRVFDILDGRDYPSYAAPRLGINGEGEIGWSRLIDWPLAAVQGTLEHFMARIDAAMWTATIVPALALLALVAAAFWYTRPLIGLHPVFVILALILIWGHLRQFMPGRVDHHMVQSVLGILAYGALLRMCFFPERIIYPVIAGLSFATGLAIGADIIPWFFFGAVLTGIFWLANGSIYERAGLACGTAVFAGALFFHIVLHDEGLFWTSACDALSVVHLSLALALPLFWGAVCVFPATLKDKPRGRFFTGLAVGIPLLVFLLILFPSCFHDPHQIENPLVREIWLSAVNEARSLPCVWKQNPATAMFLTLPPLLALAGCLWTVKTEKKDRGLWIGLALVLAGGLALTFYQARAADFILAAAIAPLAWTFAAIFERARAFIARFQLNRRQRLAGAGGFFLLCIALFAFALADKNEEQSAAVAKKQYCDLKAASAKLNELPAPLTIAAYIDAGSEILFRTPHKVLAAPYHRNEDGILAAYKILTAPDAASAHVVMKESGADILMFCDDPANPWTKDSVFIRGLLEGNEPNWLERIGDEKYGNYLIYRKTG